MVFVLSALFLQIPKYNPNGIWSAESGSKYELRLDGSDLHVKIVPGSNSKFLEYTVEAKVQEAINTYKGSGFFVARMEGGKECKFPTDWHFVVVAPQRIIGTATNVAADQKSCAIIESNQIQLDLKKEQ